MRIVRTLLIASIALASPLALSACGWVKGDKDVDTSDAEGGIGKGPGLLTGKRGGIVIFQR